MRVLIAILIATMTTGCASTRSTSLTRQDDDTYVRNGLPSTGIPVTVRVPTHVQLVVVETLYFYDQGAETSKSVDLVLLNDKFFNEKRNIKVKSNIIRTDKVMTVDMKRPAAGTLEYNLMFDTEAQYITQIESFLYDRTISDTANLIATVVPGAEQSTTADMTRSVVNFNLTPDTGAFNTTPFRNTSIYGTRPDYDPFATTPAAAPVPTPVIGSEISARIMTKDRVVAMAMFDINACDFEDQVQTFLELHVNQCHSCANEACQSTTSTSLRSTQPEVFQP